MNLFFNMVVRRAKLENLSKKELIDRLLQVEKIMLIISIYQAVVILGIVLIVTLKYALSAI